MAGKSPRKRSSGKARSGRRRSSRRGGSPLGLVALGAAMAFGATAYVDAPPQFDGLLPRLTAMVERFTPEREPAVAKQGETARKSERPRITRPDRSPDRSIETAAVPVPRPPKPLGDARKHPDRPKPVVVRPPVDVKPEPKASVPGGPDSVRLTGLIFPICGEGPGKNCVIDGDTFVIAGKAYRVADIDTPEAGEPKCRREAALAAKATRRLRDLLNAGPIELRRQGRDEDRYGRKLRTVHRDGRSLGAVLVSEGLARRWTGRRKSWCA